MLSDKLYALRIAGDETCALISINIECNTGCKNVLSTTGMTKGGEGEEREEEEGEKGERRVRGGGEETISDIVYMYT